MAKRGIALVGQSNQMTGYADDRIDWARGDPRLFQFKQNGTTVLATQEMDFPPAGAGKPFVSSSFYMVRDYLIPRFPGVDFCILPLNSGGSAFHDQALDNAWHAPHPPDYATGGTRYNFAVAQMNAFLAAETGNTIDVVILQNGEEELVAVGANQGYYATLSDTAAYTRYVTEFIAGLVADVPLASPGGVRSWPFLIGAMPPDIVYAPSFPILPNYPLGIGLSADGADHHSSARVPIYEACRDVPSSVSNCLFVDPLNPTKLQAHAGIAVDGSGFTWLSAPEYPIHYSQAALKEMGHRQFKAYMKLKGYGTPITVSYGIATGSEPVAPEAPSLDLASGSDTGSSSTDNVTSDTTPDIIVTFVTTVMEHDIVRLRDGVTELVAHEITAGEIGSLTLSLGLAPLGAGAHSLTASHERGGSASPYSAVLTFTVDVAGPTITTASTANVNEGVVLAIPLTVSGAEAVTWTETLDTGNHFQVTGSTLQWHLNGTKTFTGVVDAYSCEVTATDVAGNATAKTITVTVLDVVSASTRSFSAEGIGVTVTIGGMEFGAEGFGIVES
jgi:hypothetical protein